MKKIIIIFIAILFIILAVKFRGVPFETKENSEGSVVITVTPRDLESDPSSLSFDIALGTHSEELDSDLIVVS